MFLSYPLWWILGAGWLLWPLGGLIMFLVMLPRGHWLAPPGLWLWLVFLGSTLLSLVEVQGGSSYFSWAFNEASYLAATVLFLYVYNLRESYAVLPRYLSGFWVITLVGGLIGTLAPHLGFTTPVAHLLPSNISSNALADRFVHIQFGDVSGYGRPRPDAPFPYANRWGSIVALTTPVAMFVMSRASGPKRTVLLTVAALGLIPVVYSIDRGLWLALGAAALYALGRAVRRGHGNAFVALILGLGAAGLLLSMSSLQTVVAEKLTHAYSNKGRLNSYSATWSGFLQQPWIGHGTSGSSVGLFVGNAPVGTQGQFWALIYASGLAGAVPFFLWFLYVLFATLRLRSGLAAAYRLAGVLPLALSFTYGFVPESLMVIMACQAALMSYRKHEFDGERPLENDSVGSHSGAAGRPANGRPVRTRSRGTDAPTAAG